MNKRINILVFVLVSVFAFASCKPKQSAYKSIYESAKEREIEQAQDEKVIVREQVETTYPSTSTESVRKEKITPVYQSDASKLKQYSVVIAAMGMKPNAESLKQRMEREGHEIILVQNEQGMYRVIIASYETRDEAVSAKNKKLAEFAAQGNPSALRAKYGIPFDDWWLLHRSY